MNKKKFIGDIYYSTNSKLEKTEENIKTVDYTKKVILSLNKAKNSKLITLITIDATKDQLINIEKILKSKCGTGGTTKDGYILIQGDFMEKVYNIIKDLGFNNIKK